MLEIDDDRQSDPGALRPSQNRASNTSVTRDRSPGPRRRRALRASVAPAASSGPTMTRRDRSRCAACRAIHSPSPRHTMGERDAQGWQGGGSLTRSWVRVNAPTSANTLARAREAKLDQEQPIEIPRFEVGKTGASRTRQGNRSNWHGQASNGRGFGKGALPCAFAIRSGQACTVIDASPRRWPTRRAALARIQRGSVRDPRFLPRCEPAGRPGECAPS